MKDGKVKKSLASIGRGLEAVVTVAHNSPLRTRIYEIDERIEEIQEELEQLNEEKTRLESQLIKTTR